MRIENTSHPSSTEGTALLAMGIAMGGGNPSEASEIQEKAGQQQVVHSDQLPTRGYVPEFEALGFTFGEPDAKDPLFRPATLPDGWTKEASDHAMWSYVLDELGRRRVRVFYKAAFYDRDAFMNLITVEGYVSHCQHTGTPVVTDDTWATPAAVAEAAVGWAERAAERAANWEQRATTASEEGRADYEQWAREAHTERAAHLAIAARATADIETAAATKACCKAGHYTQGQNHTCSPTPPATA
ncbi:hypothetical protein L1I79_27605 [Strepomyces sp. STD 3.1]|nr:hypothetical protein [Streptomyces sp. STD 3.1]